VLENAASAMEGNGTPPVSVILLPEEIDMTNAEDVAAQLRDAFVPGVSVVIADLTKTRFCDSAGVRGLTLVHQRAAASGGRLHLAVATDGPVSRVLHLMDLASVLNVYPSVEAAAAAVSSGGQ